MDYLEQKHINNPYRSGDIVVLEWLLAVLLGFSFIHRFVSNSGKYGLSCIYVDDGLWVVIAIGVLLLSSVMVRHKALPKLLGPSALCIILPALFFVGSGLITWHVLTGRVLLGPYLVIQSFAYFISVIPVAILVALRHKARLQIQWLPVLVVIFSLLLLPIQSALSGIPVVVLVCMAAFAIGAYGDPRSLLEKIVVISLWWPAVLIPTSILYGARLGEWLFRGTGTGTPGPVVTAGQLLFLALAAWGLNHGSRRPLFWKIVSIIYIIAFLMTQTRGAYIALVMAVLAIYSKPVFAHLRRLSFRDKAVLICILLTVSAGISGVFLQVNRTKAASNYDHLVYAKTAYELFREAPVFGKGMGSFFYCTTHTPNMTIAAEHAHNIFLNVAAEAGIVGLVCLSAIIISVVIYARNTLVKLIKPHHVLYQAALCGLLGIGFSQLFDNYLGLQFQCLFAVVLASFGGYASRGPETAGLYSSQLEEQRALGWNRWAFYAMAISAVIILTCVASPQLRTTIISVWPMQNLPLTAEIMQVKSGELKTVMRSGGVVAGILENERGLPVSGAKVWVDGQDQYAFTDSFGSFLLRNVSTIMPVKILVSGNGIHDMSTCFSVAQGRVSELDIKVHSSLNPNLTIAGRVQDSLGNPVPGALVSVSTARTTQKTDEQGLFRLTGLASGEATITAWKSGYTSRSKLAVPCKKATRETTITILNDSANLLKNGGFEHWTPSPHQGSLSDPSCGQSVRRSPTGWLLWTTPWSAPLKLSETRNFFAGHAAAQITNLGDQQLDSGGLYQVVDVVPGAEYELTVHAWYRSPDPLVWCEMGYDLSGQTDNPEAGSVKYVKLEQYGQHTWISNSLRFRAMASKLAVYLKFGRNSEIAPAGVCVRFDEVSLTRTTGD